MAELRNLETSQMHFADRLAAAVAEKQTSVLVGLDPRLDRLPEAVAPASGELESVATAYKVFCCGVIDAVASLVPAVKPQAAFFEQLGPAGTVALAEVVSYAREKGLIVVMDAKRGDIGSTAEAYAAGFLGADSPWGADSLTVNPYLGDDSLTPFVKQAEASDAGIFVLVKTSNPGGKLFQDRVSDGSLIYEHVADHVESLAAATAGQSGYGIVGAVVGATYPAELAALRKRMPHTWFLVPGFGSQGGTAADVAPAFDEQGNGAIINSSRAIIFAHARPEYEAIGRKDWQKAVEQATLDMKSQLHDAFAST